MATPPQPPQAPKPIATDRAIGQNASSSDVVQVVSNQESEIPEYVDLPHGKELTEGEALELARSRPVQWIVLAGPSDSGKTTLLTSLYEKFQWREVEGFAFAGSRTLPGFEERCYLSRRDSGNPKPHTQRTLYKGPVPFYLHLRIRCTEGLHPFRDFLCTDVSGEMFEHARDSTEECKELVFLRRANHFLLLLDGGTGVQSDKRWGMFEEGRALLRSCVDSQMLSPDCLVNVVWSRFDYFVAAESSDENDEFRQNVEKEFHLTFDQIVPRLVFSEVAARPMKAPQLGIAYGVPALLKQWAATPLEKRATGLFPTSHSGTRESELFAARHFSSVESK